MLPQASSCPNLAHIHSDQHSFTEGVMQSIDQSSLTQIIDYKLQTDYSEIIRVLQITHHGIFNTDTVAVYELKMRTRIPVLVVELVFLMMCLMCSFTVCSVI